MTYLQVLLQASMFQKQCIDYGHTDKSFHRQMFLTDEIFLHPPGLIHILFLISISSSYRWFFLSGNGYKHCGLPSMVQSRKLTLKKINLTFKFMLILWILFNDEFFTDEFFYRWIFLPANIYHRRNFSLTNIFHGRTFSPRNIFSIYIYIVWYGML